MIKLQCIFFDSKVYIEIEGNFFDSNIVLSSNVRIKQLCHLVLLIPYSYIGIT